MSETFTPPTCSLCRRERTVDDAYDYNPLQVITGKPIGWYSGDDGAAPEYQPRHRAIRAGRWAVR